jgi:tripartite-type tricarboxylate transporter receptor subunit TctC
VKQKEAWCCFVAVACAVAGVLAHAQGRDFPNRPVRIAVPSSPGGIIDVVTRLLGQKLTEVMGQSVVIENRPGASTNIGTEIVHVPYKGGGPALASLVRGESDLSMLSLVAVLPHVSAGRVRALAITDGRRTAMLPEVPTIAESGVAGYDFTSWVGVLAPASTPPAIIASLNGYVVKAMQAPDLSKRFANEGTHVIASSPGQFGAHLKTEIARWAKVVKDSGIRAE